ncbi:MAG: hypothetical protein KatS3mg027_0792 [Bacteroidia bacterium]|nr:MAG: hypothetical protein KatS3mg027_0792 [Bacteroidia bacterium]
MLYTLLYSIEISAKIFITSLVLITFIFNLLKPQRKRNFFTKNHKVFSHLQNVSKLCGL